MKFTKLLQKLKNHALSIFVAIAMLLSANFSSFYSMANFARYTASVANAVYSAKKEHSFDFGSSDSLTTSISGNTANYDIDRDASLIDAFSHVDNQKYFPIAKYNGFTALSEIRKELTAEELKADTADNYYGVITTNDYQVARKEYTRDSDNNFVFESTKLTTVENAGTADEKSKTESVGVIYVSASKKSGETDEQYAARVASLKTILADINATKNTTTGEVLYVYLDTKTETNPSYDSNDYSLINTEGDWYKNIGKDLEGKKIDDKDIVQSDYRFYNKKTFEYAENYLAIKTNNTITLTNNNYYVVSVWVYTAGPDTTASIVVSGTDLFAKIGNISTNGLWVKYYLFIEAPAASSTNVTINLYYGDENGVTGTRTLQSYQDGTFTGTTEENYTNKKLTGTVAFDQLRLDAVNQEEFVNKTINGYNYKDIAKASLSESYSIDGANDTIIIENNNNATATKTEVDGKETTTYTYNKVSYTTIDQLSYAASYSARHANPSIAAFDASFQSYLNKTNKDLVYNFNNASALDYDTYKLNGTQYMFSYYMPRYTADDNTTVLSSAAKQAYRDRYQNGNVEYTTEELAKYGTSQLWASVVAENTEFEGYEKDKVDEFGNKIETEVDGKKETEKLEDVHNNTFITEAGQTNNILKLENKSSYELGLTTTPIYLPANAIYRVSVWAYATDEEAVAKAKLFTTIQERNSAELGTLVLKSASVTDFKYNSNSTNGWKEIIFVVQGNPYQSCNLYLSLIASGNDTVYFDNIRVDNITDQQYSNGDNKLALADKAILTSKISNGLFSNIDISSTDPMQTYPYKAESWTIDSKETTKGVVSGVISTDKTIFTTKVVPAYNEKGELDYYDQNYITYKTDRYYYEKDGANLALTYGENYLVDYKGNFVKATTLSEMFDTTVVPETKINDILQAQGLPGYAEANNYTLPTSNVYAVNLPEPTNADDKDPSFLIKSSNISSLNSNNVYKITFQVWIDANFSGKLVAKLSYDSKNLTDIELDTTKTTVNRACWQTFTIYVRTGNTSRSGISLHLAATESTGTIFFQNVNYTTLAEKTEGNKKVSANEQFDSLLKNNPTIDSQSIVNGGKVQYVRFVDMLGNNFTMHSTQKDEKTYLYESYGYTMPEKSSSDKYTQGTVAVVDMNSAQSFKFNGQDVSVSKNPATDVNTALLLRNEADTDYTVANSKFNTTLSSKKFYKVTFFVKTNDMGDKGLKVTANGINENFTNINTSATTENSGWEEYTIYVAVGSSSISSFSLSFTLGTSDNESFTGWALVSNIAIAELEEEAFNTETEKDEVKNSDKVVIKNLQTTAEEDDKQTEGEKNEFQWATFFLVFSSVLLVVALVIALVAVIVKKKAKKNPVDAANNGGIAATDTEETGGIE